MGVRLDDGFSSTILIAGIPTVKLYEKDLTPPGISGDGAVDTTTMRNTTWRTKAPRNLHSLTPVSATVAYAADAYEDIIAQRGINQLITITFPDSSTLEFYGWVEEFTPGALTEGEQPTATLVIQPSNLNPADSTESAPVFTSAESTP